MPRVTDVTALDHYKLRVSFDDGLTGVVDLSELVDAGPVFNPLRDPEHFARVYVDKATRTVAWPGDIDLDPEFLHDEASKRRVRGKRRTPRGLLAAPRMTRIIRLP